MRRSYTMWLTLLVLLCVQSTAALSQMNYYFMEGTGEPVAADATTYILKSTGGGSNRVNYTYGVNLPFQFRFNGGNYSNITVSTNGVIYFGSASVYDPNNSLRGGGYPLLAPFWDALRVSGGNISSGSPCTQPALSYGVTGTAPIASS